VLFKHNLEVELSQIWTLHASLSGVEMLDIMLPQIGSLILELLSSDEMGASSLKQSSNILDACQWNPPERAHVIGKQKGDIFSDNSVQA